jgi:predicted amidohydrolase
MKIACLQFAPQVGDIDNNLNRADAVLNKASAEDLADLDLLVLPELAFSGMRSHLHLQESTVVILDD